MAHIITDATFEQETSQRVRLPEGVFDMTTAVHGIYGE